MARKKTTKRASKQTKNRKKRFIFAYPLFIFLLLCAGVFLVAWTLRVGAANIFVTAKVSAPFVTQPATIDSPVDGTHFTAIPITVSGTCPANAGYVEIFDNNLLRGTAICSASAYSLQTDLFPATNSLVAHTFNITDDEGPVSDTVNVVYDVPPPPPSAEPTSAHHPAGPANPFILQTAFVYKAYSVGDSVQWPLEVRGGLEPYAVSVDWGDGTSDLISRAQAGQFKIRHVYSQAGGVKNSYTIKVKASDADNQSAFIQFFVIITTKNMIVPGNLYSKPPPSIQNHINWLWIAWPAYGVVTLMTVSYLLGEKEELIILRRQHLLRR